MPASVAVEYSALLARMARGGALVCALACGLFLAPGQAPAAAPVVRGMVDHTPVPAASFPNSAASPAAPLAVTVAHQKTYPPSYAGLDQARALTAPRFGLPEVLTASSGRASGAKIPTGMERSRKACPGSDLIYALGPRDYGRTSSFAGAPLGVLATPDPTGEKARDPLTLIGQPGIRNAHGLALSPLFSASWKQEFGERPAPVHERFAPVVTREPDSFTATHLDNERDSTVVGVSLDGLFRTDTGSPWSFKAAYGMDVRDRTGDQTLYGGVQWRF